MNMDTFMPDLYAGAWISLQMAVQALIACLIPGALLGALCAIPVRPLAALFRFIANAISLLPVILVLIIFYYGVLPALGDTQTPPFDVAVMALGLVYTAALAKTFSRLFEPVFSGARPVTYSRFVPGLFHDLALLLRDSSIASVIAAPELMRAAQQTMMTTFEALLPFGFAVLFYVGVGLLLIYLGKLLGWALARAGH